MVYKHKAEVAKQNEKLMDGQPDEFRDSAEKDKGIPDIIEEGSEHSSRESDEAGNSLGELEAPDGEFDNVDD